MTDLNITPEYIDTMQKELKKLALVRAFLQRAVAAGIPEQYQKISQEEFIPLLFENYYEQRYNAKGQHIALSNFIYKKPKELFSKKYIVIDGGDLMSSGRKKAGFAILFRMITTNSFGHTITGRQTVHQFNSFNYEDESRNGFLSKLESQEILFLNEINIQDFKPNLDAGSYFDELLERRADSGKPTIISFTNPVEASSNGINDNRAGIILHSLMKCDSKDATWQKNQGILRIRIKD